MTSHLSELPIGNELVCCALFGPGQDLNHHAVQVYEEHGKESFTVESSEPFSQIFADRNGFFWLAPWTEQLSDTTNILVYN
ncbi:MAG TPA: hypothetical protein VFK37_03080, partial [Bacillales bacterium]|nr:hypothetical protein [Bacillales bacterium]